MNWFKKNFQWVILGIIIFIVVIASFSYYADYREHNPSPQDESTTVAEESKSNPEPYVSPDVANEEPKISEQETQELQQETCLIKGNISYNTGEKIYHVPGCPHYDATVINTNYGERWFCSEEEAINAGWRHCGGY